ncbi:MAG: hypothetical protein IJ716_00440 [Lachnospiraceae bacterium]|nr:hypothetical protein [Lachnospiraceae bacterium]MBR1852828.1 hypothetical protein [Lachnospiraceae bacterium]
MKNVMNIKRTIRGRHINIRLTEHELTKAYRMRRSQYLAEDFRNMLDSCSSDYEHIRPELLNQEQWLYAELEDLYDQIDDSNRSYNEMLRECLDRLEKKLDPQKK